MVHGPFGAASGRIIQGSFQGGLPAFRHSVQPLRLSTVQRSAAPPSAGPAFRLPPNIDLTRRMPGQPLPPVVQRAMESFFKTSLADVRVHVGPQASAIGAVAFTMGSDLFFAPGRFDVGTPHGRQLLGHELAHVVQQRSGRVRNPFGADVAVVQDPRLEAEAEHLGAMAARHLGSALQGAAGSPGAVQRMAAPGGARTPLRTRVIQRLRLTSANTTWKETKTYVKQHSGQFGTTSRVNFGMGAEKAFQCPGCSRWLPVALATVDHMVPKSVLKDVVENQGPEVVEVFTRSNAGTYGLSSPLDFETIRIVGKGTKKFNDESKLEAYVVKHIEHDLDNLRLMCHSCNSRKRDRADNPGGSNAPSNPTSGPSADTIDFNHMGTNHSVPVSLAPGVSKDDCYPNVRFSSAWTATRQYFLAKKYHAGGTKIDFGIGAEPAYTCPKCTRKLPVALATVDHVKDKSGHWWLSLDLGNLQLMCNVCNCSKGNR